LTSEDNSRLKGIAARQNTQVDIVDVIKATVKTILQKKTEASETAKKVGSTHNGLLKVKKRTEQSDNKNKKSLIRCPEKKPHFGLFFYIK